MRVMRDRERTRLNPVSIDHSNKRDVSLFLEGKDVLAEVARLVGGKNLKLNLFRNRWDGGPPFELTRLAGVAQIELIQNLIAVNPLSPYFKFV